MCVIPNDFRSLTSFSQISFTSVKKIPLDIPLNQYFKEELWQKYV